METRRKRLSKNKETETSAGLNNIGRLEEIDNDVEGDTLFDASKSTSSSRSTRGKTKMHCLAIARVLGVRTDIQLNEFGQVIGNAGSQLQSYVGVLAREKVNITYDSWKNVPAEVKELIWESVNLSFNVNPSWKAACFTSANTKWRQFKTKLTNKFVYARIDSPDLNTPPHEYPYINASDWSAFVISRLSDNFKQLREKQIERRGLNVFPYRFSRKGYAKHASENPALLCDDPEINQATLWIEGRKNKDGVHEGDALIERVTKIDASISKKRAGALNVEETKGLSILESALESEEHNGRLRGVGGHVTQSTYYKVPRGNKAYVELYSRQQEELLEEKRKNAAQDARIEKLEAIVFKTGTEEKGSCSVTVKCRPKLNEARLQTDQDLEDNDKLGGDEMDMLDNDVQLLDKATLLQGKLVTLTLESGTSIVAYGTIVKVCGTDEHLPKNCYRVSIDEAVDENAPLPIPSSDYDKLGDAVGSVVTWPVHLLKLKEEKLKKSKKQEKRKATVDLLTLPMALRMVYCYCTAALESRGNVTIRIAERVFGKERTVYINLEDVEPFCQLQPISYTCIAVYIWHLYKRLESLGKIDKFRFVDPFNVGYMPTTRKDKKTIQNGIEQRARELAIGLDGTLPNQIVLVPCNVGEHWILTVIDPDKEEIGLLDPLYSRISDNTWQQVVQLAFKMFNAKTQRKGKKTLTWKKIKAPKQPDSFQCGYYVMKYMREIIQFDSTVMISSLQSLFIEENENYAPVEIDEVRKEWAELVQEYIGL